VEPLLAWIGAGRPITSTGGLRRADIAKGAALLDIAAVGVEKLPPLGDMLATASQPIPARSMWDVPLLAAWWQTLRALRVIDTSSTRVRPGARADDWLAQPMPPLDHMEQAAAMFIAQVVIGDLPDFATIATQIVASTTASLMRAIAPDITVDPPAETSLSHILELRAAATMDELAHMGLVEKHGDAYVVPPALRGVVAGSLYAIAAAATMDDDDD
jgi:hypothetical protein